MSGQLTLSEAANCFLFSLPAEGRSVSQQAILHFAHWCGREKHLGSLTAPAIALYAKQVSQSETGYADKLERIRAFLSYAHKKRWLKNNLASHLKTRRRTKPRLLSVPMKHQAESFSKTQPEYEEMKRELADLKTKRLKIIEDMRLAAADKDFRENAPLDAAREQRSLIEGQIQKLEATLKSTVIIDKDEKEGNKEATLKIDTGDSVLLLDPDSNRELEYTIVNPREVDPSRGKISSSSPIGRAIIGRIAGEIVEITVPSGKFRYKIIEVSR